MKISVLVLAVIVCVTAAANFASAEIIRGIDIDFVTIGNAGNAADTGGTPGCGAVGYNYRMGKYEVTNAQWNTFTAAAGAPTGNPSTAYDSGALYTDTQQPTNCVSWYETLQFCNYLTSGDKSKGAYLFSGNNANPGDFLGINRAAAKATYGTIYVLPTENEWYKAAYYKPDGSGYSIYANGTNTKPTADNGWNYFGGLYNTPWDVGIGTAEQKGTFDIMGNVWEWNETFFDGSQRGIRGGSYYGYVGYPGNGWGLAASERGTDNSYNEWDSLGFRIASYYGHVVQTPNGGENWAAGTTQTIQWQFNDPCVSQVKIKLSTNNGIDWNDVNTVPNTGSYNWFIPNLNSNQCLIRISDTNDANVYDTSDNVFIIYECQLSSPGDLNKDCKVDFADFAILAEDWLRNGNPFDEGYTE